MTFLRVFAGCCALLAARSFAQDVSDRITVEARAHTLELSWADTEDRLRGMIVPARIKAGQALHVVVDVGSYDGKPFDGPVTFQLRKDGQLYGAAATVKNERAAGWKIDFSPEETGHYSLDVSFRTTHLKVLHAGFDVGESNIPPYVIWVLGFGLVVCVVGYAVFRLVRPARPAGPPPAAPA